MDPRGSRHFLLSLNIPLIFIFLFLIENKISLITSKHYKFISVKMTCWIKLKNKIPPNIYSINILNKSCKIVSNCIALSIDCNVYTLISNWPINSISLGCQTSNMGEWVPRSSNINGLNFSPYTYYIYLYTRTVRTWHAYIYYICFGTLGSMN